MNSIIDAHHHIWVQADLPWLNGPTQPRIFGPYESIMRDYLLEEYQSDIAGTGVRKSVYVQANWAPDKAVDEVAWVQQVAEEHGTIAAIVGYADMSVPDVRPQLDKLQKYDLMRGVRQQLHWHENPMYRFASHAQMALDKNVQANIAHLADYNWSFDLQVFSAQMPGAAELAAACPDTTFILQHAGMLEDTSPEGWQLWWDSMNILARQPNVVSKLSAFGTFIHRNDPEHIKAMILETLAIFGSERCLFGSNFPIEKIWTDYKSLLNAFKDAASELDNKSREDIFCETAMSVYRL